MSSVVVCVQRSRMIRSLLRCSTDVMFSCYLLFLELAVQLHNITGGRKTNSTEIPAVSEKQKFAGSLQSTVLCCCWILLFFFFFQNLLRRFGSHPSRLHPLKIIVTPIKKTKKKHCKTTMKLSRHHVRPAAAAAAVQDESGKRLTQISCVRFHSMLH